MVTSLISVCTRMVRRIVHTHMHEPTHTQHQKEEDRTEKPPHQRGHTANQIPTLQCEVKPSGHHSGSLLTAQVASARDRLTGLAGWKVNKADSRAH